MFRFMKRLGKCWWLVALLVVATAGQVVLDFLLPRVLGEIVNTLQSAAGGTQLYEDVMSDIGGWTLTMALFAVGSGVCAVIVGICASTASAKMMTNVRQDLFQKISQFSSSEMNQYSVSSLITRTTNDITNVTNTYSYLFRFALYGPLMTIFAVVYLVSSRTGLLSLLVVAVIIVFGVLLLLLAKLVLPKYRSLQSKIDHVNLVSKETLEGLRVVRAYNAESYQNEKFAGINEDLTATSRFANRWLYVIIPVLQALIGILSVGITWLGAKLVDGGSMQYSQIAVVSEYSFMILYGFILMAGIFLQLPRTLVCAKRINTVLDTEILVNDSEVSKEQKEVGTIEFRNVSFTYPKADVPALKNVSFKVKKGETIAFIGATGSGKTTLLNLLPRLYDATEGEVLVDGINVKDYKLDDLYQKFGYVPQKPYLFHDSLRNNVCLGKPNASEEEFQRALEISQSKEFVEKLPHQTDYEISQGGKNVSGGQRQRLSIARAIIMDPEIFLFDDSFSALDYKTDKVLRGEIHEKCKGSTCVIVAQRVGTIMSADQIVVLDNGAVAGIGKHKDLLKNCEVYHEIALSQLSKEELENV